MDEISENEFDDKIEILFTDNEKIKLIGEILSNESSRKILEYVFDDAMTANQLALKTGITLSVVIHHLKKMQELSIVKINKIEKNSKEHDMKYYKAAKFAVIILPSKASAKAKVSKSLHNSLKKIYMVIAIGIATLIPWIVVRPTEHLNKPILGVNAAPALATIPTYVFWDTILSLVIIIIGLSIMLIKHRNNMTKNYNEMNY